MSTDSLETGEEVSHSLRVLEDLQGHLHDLLALDKEQLKSSLTAYEDNELNDLAAATDMLNEAAEAEISRRKGR